MCSNKVEKLLTELITYLLTLHSFSCLKPLFCSEFQVTTASGSRISTQATIFMLNSTQKFVVSDIDGTVTRLVDISV